MEIKILYEDKHIIVCIKPAGALSQADNGGADNMPDMLKELCGANEIYPLHRLDREVGGVMVYAKTKAAAAALSRDIAERRFEKEYSAWVHEKPQADRGEMRDLLFKDSKRNKSFTVKRMRKGVKEALLEYRLLKTATSDGKNYSLLAIKLHTGRTHQIRVQLSSRGMPICGDRKYGARDSFNGILLRCRKISFVHPVTGEKMSFEQETEFEI